MPTNSIASDPCPQIHVHFHLEETGGDFDEKIAAIDELINKYVAKLAPVVDDDRQPGAAYEEGAVRFAHILVTADSGNQLRCMQAWLRRGGQMPLRELAEIAGVTVKHYSGVGGGLTKNMRKAGLPSLPANHVPDIKMGQWYGETSENGERVYVIAPELVPPLRRAFGV